jgi:cytochrome b561
MAKQMQCYGGSIGIHGLMLLLIAAVYASIKLAEVFPRGSCLRDTLESWQFTLGLPVFPLVWVRAQI